MMIARPSFDDLLQRAVRERVSVATRQLAVTLSHWTASERVKA